MSKEAMKLALEALDLSHPRFGIGTAKHISATAALRQAIAEAEKQEQDEPVAWMWLLDNEIWDLCATKDRFEPMREGHVQVPLYTHPQAIAEHEPVARMYEFWDDHYDAATDGQWRKNVTLLPLDLKGCRNIQPLYTTPQQRTWVGLTIDEREQIQQECFGKVPHHVAFAHAIEAKLKEKNT